LSCQRPLPWQPGIAIDKGSFTPLLGRNSLFYPEGFWGLVLPQSRVKSGLVLPPSLCSNSCFLIIRFSFRMSADVFRGFWVQRILWDMGLNLGVFYSSVTRNIQRYSSSELEKDTTDASRRIVEFLNSWTQNEILNRTIGFDRITSLHFDLFRQGLTSESEVEYVFDWLSDLHDMNYSVPPSDRYWNRKKTFQRPTDSIETLRGNKSNPEVGKKFVYIPNTERAVPPLMQHFPEDTDLILMYYKESNEENKGVYYPNSTLTEGRNRGFQEGNPIPLLSSKVSAYLPFNSFHF
jgi:hypothetical protein